MNYISAKETASCWGITKARVIVLAREGRIPGAQLIGNSWMIPDTAQKPADGRSKCYQKNTAFRFPLLTFCQYTDEAFLRNLSSDEKSLLEGQLAFESCDYIQSFDILSRLISISNDTYVQIGALYYLCMNSIFMNKSQEYSLYMKSLKEIFAGSFPYKDDLWTIFLDIDSLYLGNDVFCSNFKIDSHHNYMSEVIPYLTVQSAYKELILNLSKHPVCSTDSLVLACQTYEAAQYPLVAQRIHLYLALIFIYNKRDAETLFHLKKALDLGVKYNSYHILSIFAPYTSLLNISELLNSYDPDFIKKIRHYGKENPQNVITFIGSNVSSAKELYALSEHQHMLIVYAIRGYTNKEVAALTGIPEYTIRRQYEALLNHFNVGKKKTLAELYLKILASGYK